MLFCQVAEDWVVNLLERVGDRDPASQLVAREVPHRRRSRSADWDAEGCDGRGVPR